MDLESKYNYYKWAIYIIPVIIGIVLLVLKIQKDNISSQISKHKDLKQERINEFIFKTALFTGSYEEKLKEIEALIQNDSILKGINFDKIIQDYRRKNKPSLQKAFSLYALNEYSEALNVFLTLEKTETDEYNLGIIKSLIGSIYIRDSEPNLEDGFKKLSEAELIFIGLKNNDETFLFQKGELFMEMGVYYKKTGDFESSKNYYNKSLVLYKKLNKSFPNRYDDMLGRLYQNIYVLYSDRSMWEQAEPFFLKAIDYKSKKKELNFDDIVILLNSYTSGGSLYSALGNFKKSLFYLNKGVKIIDELKLKKVYDSKLTLLEAGLYSNLSNTYTQQYYKTNNKDISLIKKSFNNLEKAKNLYLDVIESGKNFNDHSLTLIYYGLGASKNHLGDIKGSELEYLESIKISNKYLPNLICINGKYSIALANSYYGLSVLYLKKMNDIKKSKAFARKGIELYNL